MLFLLAGLLTFADMGYKRDVHCVIKKEGSERVNIVLNLVSISDMMLSLASSLDRESNFPLVGHWPFWHFCPFLSPFWPHRPQILGNELLEVPENGINELLRLENGGIETKMSILALLVLKIEPFWQFWAIFEAILAS